MGAVSGNTSRRKLPDRCILQRLFGRVQHNGRARFPGFRHHRRHDDPRLGRHKDNNHREGHDKIRRDQYAVDGFSVIYGSLVYLGATSRGVFEISDNGGIALAQISNEYFGIFGAVLFAIIITVACL